VTDLQALDLGMLAILGLSVLIGIWRGLVFELMSLAGWLVAYGVAMVYAAELGPYLPIGEPGSALNQAAAVVVSFVGALIVWSLLARALRMLIAATPLTVPDRILGAGFGLLRGVLVLLVMATALTLTPAAQSPWWQQSRGAQWLRVALEGLRPVLPDEITRWLPAQRPKAP
jgi:membrane protein required for colicin V production